MSKSINDFTDAELAKMVRDSIYARRSTFGSGPTDDRFLMVLAMPSRTQNVSDAIESLHDIIKFDWREHYFQVYDDRTKTFSRETHHCQCHTKRNGAE